MRTGYAWAAALLVAAQLGVASTAMAGALQCVGIEERIEDATVVGIDPDLDGSATGELTIDGVRKEDGVSVSDLTMAILSDTQLEYSDGVPIADLNELQIGEALSDVRYCPEDDTPPPASRVITLATSTSDPTVPANVLRLSAPDRPVLTVLGDDAFDTLGDTSSLGDKIDGIAFGDVNGDGFDDMIVGAPRHASLVGAVYVIYGRANLTASAIDLNTLAIGDPSVSRIVGDALTDFFLGRAVVSTDIDGDGYDDVIIGSLAGATRGEIAIVYGSDGLAGTIGAPGTVVDLGALPLTNVSFILGSQPQEQLGTSLAIGDVNADGAPDLIAGAPGAPFGGPRQGGTVFVIPGPIAPNTTIDLSSIDNDPVAFSATGIAVIVGDRADDETGISVASGDVNGDGYADVVAGAWHANAMSTTNRGAVYVVYGNASLLGTIVDLADRGSDTVLGVGCPNATTPVGETRVFGTFSNSWLGTDVAVGDFNNDGFDDVIASATGVTGPGDNFVVGEVYVIYGSASLPATTLCLALPAGTYGETRILGAEEFVRLGTSVASGDRNGDGFDDLMIGAPGAVAVGAIDSPFDETGAMYVFNGSAGLAGLLFVDAREFANLTVEGAKLNDRFGCSAAAGGDLDRNGVPEYAACAASADNPSIDLGENTAGTVSAIFGSTSAPSAARTENSVAGNAPPTDFGPVVRTVLDYAAGTASTETVTLFRSKPATPPPPEAGSVLQVHWQVSSNRGAANKPDATFQYTDAECGACDEDFLVVYSSATGASGSWARVEGQNQNLVRNEITVLGADHPAFFALVDSSGVGEILTVDLALSMTVALDPVTVGDEFAYTITVDNLGTGVATGVQVVVTDLPAGLTFVSATAPAGCTITAPYTCDLGAVDPGFPTSMTLTVSADVEGTLTSTATATANEADSNTADNVASYSMVVEAAPAPPPPDPAPDEVVTINRAKFGTRKSEWRVDGNSTVIDDTLTLYLNDPVLENEIGTASVNATGNWSFRLRNSGDVVVLGDTVTAVSSNGVTMATADIQVK